MNTALLRAKMALNGDTAEMLSETIGISLSRTILKINAKDGAQFTQSEIKKIKDKYNLSAKETVEIFFND